MPRKINRLQDAKPILEKIHQELVFAIKNAFSDWLQIRAFSNTLEGGAVSYKPRTKAGIIHDHIEKFIRNSFAGREGIIVDDFNGVFGMILQDELFIRFKKMDSTYSIRNLDTTQHIKYMKQAQIDGFPEQPTFLFAGYIPDSTWSSIKGIYVACWIGDTLEWVDEFGKYSAELAVLDFDAGESKEVKEIEKRIKLKRGRKGGRKTGTDNE
jgi:hypothetical protein